jgi:hypothetical protein
LKDQVIETIGVVFFQDFVYSYYMVMPSADTLIGDTLMNSEEVAFVHERLMLSQIQSPTDLTVESFSQSFGLMPMLVARTLSDARPEDHSLSSLIATNEFLIKTLGKSRLSRSTVEGGFIKIDKFWRNNDPLGVYKPGDMFYVDDNHPWMPYFPLLILVPSALLTLLLMLLWLAHSVTR